MIISYKNSRDKDVVISAADNRACTSRICNRLK